jgi:hypothetical protein
MRSLAFKRRFSFTNQREKPSRVDMLYTIIGLLVTRRSGEDGGYTKNKK